MTKYNLLYNATILTNEFENGARRSGIFFVVKNIFNELLSREDINLYLYCEPAKISYLKKYIEKYNLNIQILNEIEYNIFEKTKNKLWDYKQQFKKDSAPIKRSLIGLLHEIFKLIIKILNFLIIKNVVSFKLRKIDFYFSPYEQAPKIIRDVKSILISVYFHDTIPLLFPEYYPEMQKGNYWLSDLLNTLSCNDVYFANSKSTKNDVLKYSDKVSDSQIIVAPLAAENFKRITDNNLIVKTKEKYNIPSDKKYIFSLCTLEPRKNLIRAVKTFVQFIDKNNIDDLVFVLGGGHWCEFISKLESEIENLNEYKDKIIKAGYIDDEDLAPLYSGAEWFVYTSQYEGFGLPPLEAMSCGCPVVTSNNSSLPEVVGDAGIMIDWDSDEQHVQAYEKYYFGKELREENILKGLARAKIFSWKSCTDVIVETLVSKK